jgi:hypothetical protein
MAHINDMPTKAKRPSGEKRVCQCEYGPHPFQPLEVVEVPFSSGSLFGVLPICCL